ncbi:MAG TPA: DUF4097 family beta strand repeat-containing protein [Kofleriaceae bacterium]|nr:DUF4097 family beta strand repeat-containing protein [Kofleriaceae bacterium]
MTRPVMRLGAGARALIGLVGLVGLLAAAGPAAADPPLVERARLELQPPGRPFKKVEIENPLGDVRVEGHDKATIEIETRKQGPTEEALDRLHISLTPSPDGTVRLTTTVDGGREVRPLLRGAVKLDLIVRAPRDARIEAASSSGALEIQNMDAGGDLDTASGRIAVRNVSGELSTHSMSGPTQLTQVFGSVDAQTLSSQIDLDSINGEKLIASATEGKIAGRRVRSRHVELTTVSGMIVLEGEAPLRGRMIVASARGDVTVRMRSGGAIVVRARAVKVDLGGAAAQPQPDGWIEAQFGPHASTAPSLIELRSRSGNVSFAVVQ